MKIEVHSLRILLSFQRRKSYRFCNNDSHDSITCSFVKAEFFCTKIDDLGSKGKGVAELFSKWGCSQSDIAKIFARQPSLRNAGVSNLESKLGLLRKVGIGSSDLVKIINCRPRFLSYRLSNLDIRLDDLHCLFGSPEVFLKTVVRNPSLLIYDFEKKVKPVVSLYEQMGIGKADLISMLSLRPTLISRTNFSNEKLDYIHRTGVTKQSKMYKYVVTIMGVSRVETICEKMANLEKFGFTEDEVLELFGRTPLLMTLSVEKVQRHMTFVVGTMKLPAKAVIAYPFLLFANLEGVLKPRVLLASKINDMDLHPQFKGPEAELMKALRMSEDRFLNKFVLCHEDAIKLELLEYYQTTKRIKRLAQSSKKTSFSNGFPL